MFKIPQIFSIPKAQLAKVLTHKPLFLQRLANAISSVYVKAFWDTGITYEITNAKGVKSYLIATSIVDEESIQKGSFRRILGKSSRLFSEDGNDACAKMYKQIAKDRSLQHLPFRFCLETAIVGEAERKKIPVIELRKIPTHELDEIEPAQLRKRLVDGLERVNKDPEIVLAVNKWKERNVRYLAERRFAQPYGKIAQREDGWMKILVPELTNAEKTICIAVGCYHVVGYKGLVERLRTEGFTVKLLTGRPPNAVLVQRIAKRMFARLSLKAAVAPSVTKIEDHSKPVPA